MMWRREDVIIEDDKMFKLCLNYMLVLQEKFSHPWHVTPFNSDQAKGIPSFVITGVIDLDLPLKLEENLDHHVCIMTYTVQLIHF